MLKLFFVIFANFHRAPYIVPKMRYMADHPQKYSEAERYDMMRHCIDLMNKSGKITTEAYGLENLPETGGYIMYPNHQESMIYWGLLLHMTRYCRLLWISRSLIQCLSGNLWIWFRQSV